jgi:hypothetical protein
MHYLLGYMSCTPLKVNRRFGGTYHLRIPPDYTLVSSLAYSSTPKMEAILSSETSVDSQQITRRYIPEDGTLEIDTYLFKKPFKSLKELNRN